MSNTKGHVSVHALDAGFLTLPESFFVTPLEDPTARKTVPSLSFLIQHTNSKTQGTTRLVFDLGIRQTLTDYSAPIRKHIRTREPISGDPDTIASLARGGLRPDDIDFVAFSHLHWDHIGTPAHFPTSTYVVGPGAASLVDGSCPSDALGSHNHFEQGILDLKRTFELGPVGAPVTPPLANGTTKPCLGRVSLSRSWKPLGLFNATMDIFDDGSLYIVSAPGHLDGHINMLCRLEDGRYIYLAGDACHDTRLLTGEKQIATWTDQAHPLSICCIHKDKAAAEKTLDIIRRTMNGESELGRVEVVFAHDVAWEEEAKRLGRFFPGAL